jgi:hypothetical protein
MPMRWRRLAVAQRRTQISRAGAEGRRSRRAALTGGDGAQIFEFGKLLDAREVSARARLGRGRTLTNCTPARDGRAAKLGAVRRSRACLCVPRSSNQEVAIETDREGLQCNDLRKPRKTTGICTSNQSAHHLANSARICMLLEISVLSVF